MAEIGLQVGVKAFLKNSGGKFLLLKRNPSKYQKVKGEWDIPGGRINPGSSLIENLKREIKEETELGVKSHPKLIHVQDIIPNTEKHVVRITYLAETEGEPKLDTTENIEYKWLSLLEIKNQENLDIYVKEIIDLGLIPPNF